MPSNSIKSSTPSLKTSDDEKASIRSEFRWGGCSDNIDLGYKIAVAYLDDRETGRDFKAKIRLHNHRVGRIVSRRNFLVVSLDHNQSIFL